MVVRKGIHQLEFSGDDTAGSKNNDMVGIWENPGIDDPLEKAVTRAAAVWFPEGTGEKYRDLSFWWSVGADDETECVLEFWEKKGRIIYDNAILGKMRITLFLYTAACHRIMPDNIF